jgi:glycosyltransferase involved in cell wall biosynthesis
MENKVPNDFDWKGYFELNPSIKEMYGHLGERGAIAHWSQYGYKEDRLYNISCSQKKIILTDKNTSESTDEINVSKDITIVIPNKNGENPNITIASLYNQTYKNFDIIVINDFNNNANQARNRGLKLVKTPFVLFSDNDIEWHPDAIYYLRRCLIENPEVSYTYGSWTMGSVLTSNKEWDGIELKKNNYISTMSLVRTHAHPGFDESIKRLQDWDLWLTMLEQGKRGKFVNREIFTTKRRNGITNNSISWDESYNEISKKHFSNKNLTTTNVILEKYYSVIIPTMWLSDKLLPMLKIYENCEYVKEIILIDNDPTKTIDLTEFSKIKYNTKGKNIYVNPSWNWGYSLSNYELILANDDILIENLDDVLDLISKSDCDIIGMDVSKNSKNLKIEYIDKFPEKSYGCFMYVKKYTYIPDQLKIWYGDRILFDASKTRGVLKNPYITTDKSVTINSNIPLFRENVGKRDIIEYGALEISKERLNVILRTSNRPQYFYRCIESIKKYAPEARVHITIDNINDIEYVRKYADGIDYSYYLIDKDVVSDICKKIPIERDPFIFNYYINIVKPFLNGWCLFLDDDDELLTDLLFEKDKNKIYLFKVDVVTKIVPSPRNFGNKPVLNDISSLGIVFHHTQMVDWTPQRGGDYSFISEIYNNYPSEWIDEIISKVQLSPHFGKAGDLKDKQISVNLATYPPRKDSLIKCIRNLLKIDVIDVIRVYLNEYTEIPEDLPVHYKITYLLGKKNLKDTGKFYWCGEHKSEYYFTIDDDLIYPKSYFIEHLLLLRQHENEIFVSLHGKVMKEKPIGFNDNTISYHCLRDVKENSWINNCGTGVLVFDNSKFVIPIEMFKYHGMADLWISTYCQKNKIPILCRKHKIDELEYIDNKDTLFDRRDEMKNDHRKVLDIINKWALFKK